MDPTLVNVEEILNGHGVEFADVPGSDLPDYLPRCDRGDPLGGC
jgi:hypothetical protein